MIRDTVISHIRYPIALAVALYISSFAFPSYSYLPNDNCHRLYNSFYNSIGDNKRLAGSYGLQIGYKELHHASRKETHSSSLRHVRKHKLVRSIHPQLKQNYAVSEQKDNILGENAQVVSDVELSNLRGGFIAAGGLRIDFGLVTTTSIDGMVQNTLNLSSNNVNGSIPTNLQQLVQAGSNNQAATPAGLQNNVLTIVQNTANNKVIQNTNILNMTVHNINNIRSQQALYNSNVTKVLALH